MDVQRAADQHEPADMSSAGVVARAPQSAPGAPGAPSADLRPLAPGRGGPQGTLGSAPTASLTGIALRLAIGVVALVILMAALGALASLVQEAEVNALDSVASPFVHGFASPVLDAVMGAASVIGSTVILLPLTALVAVVAWARRRPSLALLTVVSAGGGVLVNELLKAIVHRPRPTLEWAVAPPDYSFPSGHSMDSLVVFLTIAFVAWGLAGRRAGIVAAGVALVLAVLIGVSRIYLGAHYLTDVIGGYIAGGAWLIVVVGAFDAGTRRRTRRAVGTPPGPGSGGTAGNAGPRSH